MKLVTKDLLDEHDRWKRAFEKDNARFNGCVIKITDILDSHFSLIDFLFQRRLADRPGNYIGAIDGLRLTSAVSRQQDDFAGQFKGDTDYKKCATLFYSLISSRPFQRFNNSTALLSMLFYLSKIGRVPTAHYKELEIITRIIASNEIRQRGAFRPYSEFEDGEVLFLARYLQENTRQIEEKDVVLTYSAVNSVLETAGLSLLHPHGRSIDVFRKQSPLSVFKRSGNKDKYVKIGTIEFTGWTDKVPDSELSRLRGITASNPSCDVWCQPSISNRTLQLSSLIHIYYRVFQCIAEDDEKRFRDHRLDKVMAVSGCR